MMFLHKLLPLFVLPLGITLLLLLIGAWLRRWVFIWVGVAFLWLSSTPVVSTLLVRMAEGGAERGLAADAPIADAIVVLSEGRVIAPGTAAVSEWVDADRFFGGMELFKAGKAPLLVFTGGATSDRGSRAALEGDVLARHATTMGVPSAHIATTSRVVSTEEEARAVAAILRERISGKGVRPGHPSVLLVTSAFHMSRARTLFARAGMSVLPFPVDFKISTRGSLSLLAFVPNGGALRLSELALREGYGRLFYAVAR